MPARSTNAPADLEQPVSNTYKPPAEPVPSAFDRIPLPLVPTVIARGGVFEIFEEVDGELTRLGFASDMISGLQLTTSLTELDTLSFSVPFDRFAAVPGTDSPATLREMQSTWQSEHDDLSTSPYDKQRMFQPHVYVKYTEPVAKERRERLFRVLTLDDTNETELSGTAVDAATKLSDYLTQYVAGRSQFIGMTASEIAPKILAGYQSVRVQNRRFSRDAPVRLTMANDSIRDQSWTGNVVHIERYPYMIEIVSAVPEEAALFSGLPHETVPPHGYSRPLQTGYIGYMSWSDEAKFAGAGHSSDGSAVKKIPGPINFAQSSGTPFQSGEPTTNSCRVLCGAIKASGTGTHDFEFISNNGHRLMFGDDLITDNLVRNQTSVTSTWSADLEDGLWYPIIIINIRGGNADQHNMTLKWTPPSTGTFALIPAANLSHQHHGDLGLVRFADGDGAVRFFAFYKQWHGKSIVLAYPLNKVILPGSITDDNEKWPKGVLAGTIFEEVILPTDKEKGNVLNWGTGWTRNPGPVLKNQAPLEVARFQPISNFY